MKNSTLGILILSLLFTITTHAVTAVTQTRTLIIGVTSPIVSQPAKVVRSYAEFKANYLTRTNLNFNGHSYKNIVAASAKLFFANGGKVLGVKTIQAPTYKLFVQALGEVKDIAFFSNIITPEASFLSYGEQVSLLNIKEQDKSHIFPKLFRIGMNTYELHFGLSFEG